jgi:thioredoxin reductase (NADPH)
MAAALYAARANLRTVLLDKLGVGGGQLLTTDVIEDYPGYASISGDELARTFSEQVQQFGVDVEYGEVTNVEVRGQHRVVRTADGVEYVAKAVIVCTGGSPLKLGVPGEAELAMRGVSYCALCDGAFFTDQDLVVVGGGDAAIEEAAFLTRFARRVYVVHRRGQWRAQRLIQDRAKENPKIEPVWYTKLEEIGGGDRVEWVRVRDTRTGEQRTLPVGGVFIYIGFKPNSELLGAQVARDGQGFVLVDDKMEADVPGVFVAGDVRRQYVRQIANAVGDATTAAVAATRYIEALEGGHPRASSLVRIGLPRSA